jgi:selenophosphate synthetase-related protein
MKSKDGEIVKLNKPVFTNRVDVDSWLKSFQNSMILSIKDALFKTFEKQDSLDMEEWISEFPG